MFVEETGWGGGEGRAEAFQAGDSNCSSSSAEKLDTLKRLKWVTRTQWAKERILKDEAESYRVLDFILRIIRKQGGILSWEVMGFPGILPLWPPSFKQTLIIYRSASDVAHSADHTLQTGPGEYRVGWVPASFVLDTGRVHPNSAFAWMAPMWWYCSYRPCAELKQYLI